MRVEFWRRKHLLATCDDGGRIEARDCIVINAVEYMATKVSYTVDRGLVCAVELRGITEDDCYV